MADRIKVTRLKSGLSQAELSVQTDLTQQMISKLENGRSQSTSAIFAIGKALGVSAYWLWLGEGDNSHQGSNAAFFDGRSLSEAWLLLSDSQRNEICEYIVQLSKSKLSNTAD
ncbi:MAG: helix-turn-helix transcriptional regulator [Porticoccus sp.]